MLPLANKVENIDRGRLGVCDFRWHINRFSHFCRVHAYDQQTDTQADHANVQQ